VIGDDERHQERDQEAQGQVQQRVHRVRIGQSQPGRGGDDEQDVDQPQSVPDADQPAPGFQLPD
jgi:hypothetical protein